MKILIGMETTGEVRRAFAARGWHAVSVDLLPADRVVSGPWRTQQHWIGDVRDFVSRDWDMFIFHPECTYLTSSAEWLYKIHQTKNLKPGTLYGRKRREARKRAIEFVIDLWDRSKHIPRRCMENPIGVLSTAFRKPDQIIQPYKFGEDASKATCLWLDGLPTLVPNPSDYIKPRMVCRKCGGVFHYDLAGKGCPHCGAEAGLALPRWANQTDSGQNRLPPSADRWKKRAATYPGIAAAMAARWGNLYGSSPCASPGAQWRQSCRRQSPLDQEHTMTTEILKVRSVILSTGHTGGELYDETSGTVYLCGTERECYDAKRAIEAMDSAIDH